MLVFELVTGIKIRVVHVKDQARNFSLSTWGRFPLGDRPPPPRGVPGGGRECSQGPWAPAFLSSSAIAATTGCHLRPAWVPMIHRHRCPQPAASGRSLRSRHRSGTPRATWGFVGMKADGPLAFPVSSTRVPFSPGDWPPRLQLTAQPQASSPSFLSPGPQVNSRPPVPLKHCTPPPLSSRREPVPSVHSETGLEEAGDNQEGSPQEEELVVGVWDSGEGHERHGSGTLGASLRFWQKQGR